MKPLPFIKARAVYGKAVKRRRGGLSFAPLSHAPRCGVVGALAVLCGFPFAPATVAQEQAPSAIVPDEAGPTATRPPEAADLRIAPLRENEAPERPALPDQRRDPYSEGEGVAEGPFVIEMPELSIIGKSPEPDVVIQMPQLTITGKSRARDVVIQMPELVIIGRPKDEKRSTGGLGETTPSGGRLPSAPDSIADPTDETASAAWCLGSYTAHAGRGTGTAAGIAMPVGQAERVPAEVTAVECRQTLQASIAGAPVTLARTDAPDTYSGTIDLGDGAARLLTLTCGDDLNLRGSLVAAHANMRVARPVWLIRDPASPADLPLGCMR